MNQTEASLLKDLWRFSEEVYKTERFLYFVCKSEYSFKDGIDKQLEIERDNLPGKFTTPKGLDFVYSCPLRDRHEIMDIGNFLNNKLPAFVNKETCEFHASVETTVLYNVAPDEKLDLINENAPVFTQVISLFNLLKQSASYISEENSKFVFWINSTAANGKSISRVVDFTFESATIPQLIQSEKELRLPSFSGPHAHDKAVLFKRALTESLTDCDEANASSILNRLDKVDRIFENEFSAYVNKFGLDKSLNELYDKLNDILGKIFDVIQGTTLKLLIVPGTMLATIFMRQRDASDWKILFILLVVGVLVYLLHFETKKYIDKISNNGQQLLDSIINMNAHQVQNEAIKEPQQEVKTRLCNLSRETKKRINFYLVGSLIALVAWAFIVFWAKLSLFLGEHATVISKICACY